MGLVRPDDAMDHRQCACRHSKLVPRRPWQTSLAPALTAGTLNRAEWVKFLGLFFNKEKEASQYFDTVERQYNRLKVGREVHTAD